MQLIEGYWNIKPKIKKLDFPTQGKMQVYLEDGRSLLIPLSAFPSIKKIPVNQRKKWYLIGGGVTWDTCSEIVHVEQFLGNYTLYSHEA